MRRKFPSWALVKSNQFNAMQHTSFNMLLYYTNIDFKVNMFSNINYRGRDSEQ